MGVDPRVGLTFQQFQKRIIDDPEWYVREVLGNDQVWEKQLDILRAVLQAPKRRTAVRGCVASSKTVAGAMVVHAFMDAFGPECEVYTTAPTFRQTQKFLWKHIRLLHKNSLAPRGGKILPGRPDWRINDNWSATGFSPKDADAFQGAHAPNILIVIDEAQGVRQEIIEAAENALAGGRAHLLLLFNPNAGPGEEAYECNHSKRKLYTNIKISAYDTPNVKAGKTVINGMIERQAVDEWEDTYTKKSNFFRIKVLAEYPLQDKDALFPIGWIEKAMHRDPDDKGRVVIGCDVARGESESADDSSIAPMHGRSVQELIIMHGKDGVQLAARLKIEIKERNAVKTFIDDIGVGAGPTDILKHDDEVTGIHGVNVGKKAKNKVRFDSLKAEIGWGLRDVLNPKADNRISLPLDQELLAELSSYQYDIKKGRIWVLDKASQKKKLGKSPDRGDSVILANYASTASITIASAAADPDGGMTSADGSQNTRRDRLMSRLGKQRPRGLGRRRGMDRF